VLGALLPLHSSTSHHDTNLSDNDILAVLSHVGCNWVCHLFVTRASPPGRGKHLSLIQKVLLAPLNAGFEKRANYRCDCDGYRPDTSPG